MDNLPVNSNNSMSEQFTKELLNPSIDLVIDYSEIYIDDLIQNEAINEVPIIKTVVGVIKTGISINKFFFAKKLLSFIREFNTGQIDEEKKVKFQQKIYDDPKFRKKATEQIMICLDRFNDIKKSLILANLLKAYVEEKISFEKFVSISISMERLHPSSYSFFISLEEVNYIIGHEFEGNRDYDSESLLLSSGLAKEGPSDWWNGFTLKEEGILLYEFGIKPLRE
ncbi:hypothetical protein [Flavobacterium geliluteum]|uniref:Uncharacterized protein n=1 Tax=Flavobacterium geliluteum TaxID=2816120 RepID=A0A940XGP8_9FLAO|nr:hypothetical protein [Flavobacterium geliluteum]MBP4139439.1 hypothetical protein [Flavobacterium geliluteum]